MGQGNIKKIFPATTVQIDKIGFYWKIPDIKYVSVSFKKGYSDSANITFLSFIYVYMMQ